MNDNPLEQKDWATAAALLLSPGFEFKEEWDPVFYVQWLLFTKHDYPLGLKKLAELLRRGDLHELEQAGLRAMLAELLDPKADLYDIKLIAKETNRAKKRRVRDYADGRLAQAVKQAQREGLTKTAALQKVAPGRERQVARTIANHKKRLSRFRIFRHLLRD